MRDDWTRQTEELLRAGVTSLDEIEIADVFRPNAEFGGVSPRGEGLAVSPPDRGAQPLSLVQLCQDLPKTDVHRVVGRVVLFGPVVAQDRNRAVVLESDQLTAHAASFNTFATLRASAGRAPGERQVDQARA